MGAVGLGVMMYPYFIWLLCATKQGKTPPIYQPLDVIVYLLMGVGLFYPVFGILTGVVLLIVNAVVCHRQRGKEQGV